MIPTIASYKLTQMCRIGGSLVLIISFAVDLVCIYQVNSTLPWWGYIITCVLAYIFILFTGALYRVTGFLLQIQSLIQMIGVIYTRGFLSQTCTSPASDIIRFTKDCTCSRTSS